MFLHEIKKSNGNRKRKKRKGIGEGSGNGKTAGRGHKGQKSRSGSSIKPSFEGGQMPLARKLPFSRGEGFTNFHFKKHYAIINLSDLGQFSNEELVDINFLKSRGIVRSSASLLKVLGHGNLDVAVNVQAHKFSKTASEQIEKAGGTVKVIAAE